MSDRPLFVGPLLHLRTVPALHRLSQAQLAPLANELEEVGLPRGTLLLSPAEPPSAIYLLVEGFVHVSPHGPSGVGPGDVIGFLEALAPNASNTIARTTSDVVAFRLATDSLRNVCEQDFPTLAALLAYLADRVAGYPEALLPALSAGPDPSSLLASPLDRVGRLLALNRVPAFPSASMDALAELAGYAREVHLEAGEALWLAGAPAVGFHVVCSGEIELSGQAWGPVSTVGPGAVPGLVATLAGTRLNYEARAKTAATVLHVGAEPFLDVLEDHFEMAYGILGRLAARLLAVGDAPQR